MNKMGFLFNKFKGKYAVRCEYDQNTMDYPRTLKGNYEEADVYVKCKNNIRVYYYGRGIMECYIPSLQRGRNIVRKIYRDKINESNTQTVENDKSTSIHILDTHKFDKDIEALDKKDFIFNVREFDQEVLFWLRWENMDELAQYVSPMTSAARRSPFSSKNLPKSDYVIPQEDMDRYKNSIHDVDMIKIKSANKNFYTKLFNKKKLEQNNAERKKLCMDFKQYIHYKGLWDKYVDYLSAELR